MNTIYTTGHFDDWLASRRDGIARLQIARRIERAENGNFGDHKHISDALWEMRIHYGPGYRVYYAQKDDVIYILLCGGDKSTQGKDIDLARKIWGNINA